MLFCIHFVSIYLESLKQFVNLEMNVQFQSPPITTQPGTEVMQSQGIDNFALVEYFTTRRRFKAIESLFGCRMNNEFNISDNSGQHLYNVVENTPFCMRNCCCSLRSLNMTLMNKEGFPMALMERDQIKGCCCSPCCACSPDTLKVSAPTSNVIGFVKYERSMFSTAYSIQNALGESIIKIQGPSCAFGLCGHVDFKAYSISSGEQIGEIRRKWDGCCRVMCTNLDTFIISFPSDADVKIKTLLLATSFLIDAIHFDGMLNMDMDQL